MLSSVKETLCNNEETGDARNNTSAEDGNTQKTTINSTLENDKSNKPNNSYFKDALPMPEEVRMLEELTSTILFQAFSCKIFEKVKRKNKNTQEMYLEHFKNLNKEVVQIISEKFFNSVNTGGDKSDEGSSEGCSEENSHTPKIEISTLRAIQFILK